MSYSCNAGWFCKFLFVCSTEIDTCISSKEKKLFYCKTISHANYNSKHGKVVKIIANWLEEIPCFMQINHSVKRHSVISYFHGSIYKILRSRFKKKHCKYCSDNFMGLKPVLILDFMLR